MPLRETVEAMEARVADGKILGWGISNFDTDEMRELIAVGGGRCQTDQILYNLMTPGPEHDLLPFLATKSMLTMAYSPAAPGPTARQPCLGGLRERAKRVACPDRTRLAFTRPDVIAIPKTRSVTRVRENCAAVDLVLSDDDLRHLDRLFQPPNGPELLRML